MGFIGLILPWLVITGCELYFGDNVRELPRQMFTPGYSYFLVGIYNAIPFFIVGAIVQLMANTRKLAKVEISRVVAVRVLVVGLLVLSLWGQLDIWNSTFNPAVHSSTAAIGIYVLFVLSILFIPFGYFLGWVIGKMMASASQHEKGVHS